MENLPTYYKRGSKINGIFHHTLVRRSDRKAMYKVEFEPPHSAERSPAGFEVFQVKKQKEMDLVLNGVSVHYDEKEMTPSDEAFGKWAWSVKRGCNEELAYEHMKLPEVQINEEGAEVKRGRGRPKKVVV